MDYKGKKITGNKTVFDKMNDPDSQWSIFNNKINKIEKKGDSVKTKVKKLKAKITGNTYFNY